jgi:transcriptional regulator with XRE-family HTH domain
VSKFTVHYFDIAAIYERACKAIFATGRTYREVAEQMGMDTSVPFGKRMIPQPTRSTIKKASQVLGVSEKWLVTGIPETQMDFIASRPLVALYGDNIVTGNNNSEIAINSDTGANSPVKQKNPCPACKNRRNRE